MFPTSRPLKSIELPSPDLNIDAPSQPRMKDYPKTLYSEGKSSYSRNFQSAWYNGRTWLEYSVEQDACYCFPCRIYGVNKSAANKTFTVTGFRNWKAALGGKDKGFTKHENSPFHLRNIESWTQQQKRKDQGKSLETVINVIEEDHVKWLEVIFHIVRYLCANGLPFRGDEECLDFNEGLSGGLFLNTINTLVFQMQPELETIAKKMPRNAKYLSSDVQNEIIEILSSLVKEKHAARIRRAEFYTIMADGTTDKNHEEIQGVVIRFIDMDTCEVEERAINVGNSGRSAEGIFNYVKKTLDDSTISFDGMVSQAFDGASVMSGEKGGLQTLISKYCGRNVVYIHCFCHRLHLSIKAAMSGPNGLDDHFDTVTALYSFFKLAAVHEEYNGENLKRLIVTRWSGHLRSCKKIQDNYHEIVRTLESARMNKRLKVDDRAKATGLFVQAISRDFIFFNYFITDVLSNCDIACKILQSSRENLNSAMQSIAAVREELQAKRDVYNADKVESIIKTTREKQTYEEIDDSNKKRVVKRPPRMEDFFITERLPGNEPDSLHQTAKECLDTLETDFSRRFATENTVLWSSMECLLPSSSDFLCAKKLKPFYEYCCAIPAVSAIFISKNITDLDFNSECQVFKRIITKENNDKFLNERNKYDLNKLCSFMMKTHADTAPTLTILYRVATTAGFASARVESLFSALSQIDVPQRRSMTTKRESELTFLYFEKKTLMSVTFKEFLTQWRLKPRKLNF